LLRIRRSEGQGIAPDDVPLKDESYRLLALVLSRGLEEARVACLKYLKEPSSTIADNIVGQDINPGDRRDSQDGITLCALTVLSPIRMCSTGTTKLGFGCIDHFPLGGDPIPAGFRREKMPSAYNRAT
jgi:hypothetical protein